MTTDASVESPGMPRGRGKGEGLCDMKRVKTGWLMGVAAGLLFGLAAGYGAGMMELARGGGVWLESAMRVVGRLVVLYLLLYCSLSLPIVVTSAVTAAGRSRGNTAPALWKVVALGLLMTLIGAWCGVTAWNVAGGMMKRSLAGEAQGASCTAVAWNLPHAFSILRWRMETLLFGGRGGVPRWRDPLFLFMAAMAALVFFGGIREKRSLCSSVGHELRLGLGALRSLFERGMPVVLAAAAAVYVYRLTTALVSGAAIYEMLCWCALMAAVIGAVFLVLVLSDAAGGGGWVFYPSLLAFGGGGMTVAAFPECDAQARELLQMGTLERVGILPAAFAFARAGSAALFTGSLLALCALSGIEPGMKLQGGCLLCALLVSPLLNEAVFLCLLLAVGVFVGVVSSSPPALGPLVLGLLFPLAGFVDAVSACAVVQLCSRRFCRDARSMDSAAERRDSGSAGASAAQSTSRRSSRRRGRGGGRRSSNGGGGNGGSGN